MRSFDPHARQADLAVPDEIQRFGHTLYRFYDASGVLLYVGITRGDPRNRWAMHQRDSHWWPTVAYVSVEHPPDRESARASELAAISTEHPIHNIADRDKPAALVSKPGPPQRHLPPREPHSPASVTTTEVRENLLDLAHLVAIEGEPIAVTRHGKIKAGLVSSQDLELLELIRGGFLTVREVSG